MRSALKFLYGTVDNIEAEEMFARITELENSESNAELAFEKQIFLKNNWQNFFEPVKRLDEQQSKIIETLNNRDRK